MTFEFNNPLLYELREDLISKQDLCVISNESKIVLDELPSEFYGVTVVLVGTAQAGASSTITLKSSASATDDRYNNFTITITGGTGSGQSKLITDYVGSTKVATISGTWTTNPDNTSVYSIACYNESKIITGLSINSFYVNYLNSIITFNSSEIGQTVLASYQGRGVILLSAERVYTKSVDGAATQNLQDVADSVGDASTVISNLNSAIATGNSANSTLISTTSTANSTKNDLTNINSTADQTKTDLTSINNTSITTKNDLTSINDTATTTKTDLTSINNTATTTISNLTSINNTALTTKTDLTSINSTATQTKTDLTSINSTASTTKTDLTAINVTANATINDLETLIANNQYSIESENTRISNEEDRVLAESNRVIEYQAMINSSKMILKNPVDSYSNIATTYPSPVIYWTVRTIDDGKMYRYDGSVWVWFDTLSLTAYDTLVTDFNLYKADYTHQSVSAMKASTALAGNRLKTSGYYAINDGGGAEYVIQDATTEPSSFYVTLTNGKKAVLANNIVHPLQAGFKTNVAELDTVTKVNDNWTILKNLIADLKTSKTREMIKFDTLLTANRVYAEWISGRECPIGFYSDSTTDGATTTGHVSSVGTTDPFAVTVTESPNAYPTKLEEYIKLVANDSTVPVRCYNGGFDGKSYAGGWGLQYWYNTWFRGLAGSNIDFSDVKMIVLGFGTSDSINMDNTATTIDNFIRDLECTVIDCFLRGVQPVIQAPVLTTEHVGTTVSYRNGNESVTIIETCQKQLCQKYNLEYFSMSEPVEEILEMFSSMKYSDFIAVVDMVHPGDMGHRLHASYLVPKFNPNIARIDKGKSLKTLFPGHPVFIPTATDIISPISKGGVILKTIESGYLSDDTYYYCWRDSEGNTKIFNDYLLSFPVYVDKPTALFYTPLDTSVATGRPIAINSTVVGSAITITTKHETYRQPEAMYFTNKGYVCMLPPGLSMITVRASDNVIEQRIGSFYLADAEEHLIFEYGRGSGSTAYATKVINYPPIPGTYVKKDVKKKAVVKDYYSLGDNVPTSICMTLEAAFAVGTTYSIYTHYQDVQAYKDCYNLVEILGDVITLKVKKLSGTTTIFTQSVSGLNALLVAGARIKLNFTPKFYLPGGVEFSLFVNGVSKHTYTASIGDVWSDGYGFDAPSVLSSNIYMTMRQTTPGFDMKYLI